MSDRGSLENLKQEIVENIYTNENQAVTGDLLQDVLIDAVDTMGVSVSQNIETGKEELLIGDIPALIVDNVPEPESDNIVKSGGVNNAIIITEIGASLRGDSTGGGGQASYFSFDALTAGDYYILINSANDLQNIFIGLATGTGSQYITQRLIDDEPITAGNHYFKVTLIGSEVRIKISTKSDQNVAPAGITWSINESKILSLNIADTGGNKKDKIVLSLRENIGSANVPVFKDISNVDIMPASKTKAGVMTAFDKTNELNATEFTIDIDIANSNEVSYLTPEIETLVGGDFTAFEIDIIENTVVFNTNSYLGVLLNNSSFNTIHNVNKYSNKLYYLGSDSTTGFRLYVRPNVVSTAGHLKAKIRMFNNSNNVESLVFAYTLNSIDGLDDWTIDISPLIHSFGSPYAKFKIEVLENTIGVVSGREKQFLVAHVGVSDYELITLDDDNSKVVNCTRGNSSFSIALRQGSFSSIGRIVFAIHLNEESYIRKNQGVENAGKILGIDDTGNVIPTINVPQKDIYQLGGVPSYMGAENANKTLVIDDGGNVIPGIVTEQGILTGVVQYHQTDNIYLGADVLVGSTVVLGTGWSGNLSDGFTHIAGNTDDLIIQYDTTEGTKYIVGLILGSASEASIYVTIGDLPVVDVYNGSTNANIGIKSEGGYLKITPASEYNSTVKVTLKEVVEQAESESVLTLNSRNVNHGNTTDNITGFWNVAVGADNTLRKNQNGSRNIALGYSALANFTSGTRNIGIGTFAMSQLVSGDHNIAIGSDSLWYINKASDNVAIGFGAFWQMPSGANFDAQRNTVIGAKTMMGALVSSYDNIAIGYNAGKCSNVTSPSNNIAIGNNSGFYAKENNVAIGHNAGRYTNGSRNVAIGADAGAVSNVEQNNSIAIGYNVKTTKSNQCIIGNSDVTEFVFGGKKIIFNNDNSITWENV